MKTYWQRLQQWWAATQAAGQAARRRLGAQLAAVPWPVVLGTLAGATLAVLVYLALAATTAAEATDPGSRQLAQRLRVIIPPEAAAATDYSLDADFDELDKSFDPIDRQLQQRNEARPTLTLPELLAFRQQLVDHSQQLYYGLDYLRTAYPDLQISSATDHELFKSSLRIHLGYFQDRALAILDSVQYDLATMQLQYLEQPGPQARPFVAQRLALARLQRREAQRAVPTDSQTHAMPPLQAQLRLATTLALLRDEVPNKRDAALRQLLDSCQREVRLLRWLDSCRAQQRWLEVATNDSSRQAPTDIPPVADDGIDELAPSFWLRYQWVLLTGLVLVLLLLPLGLFFLSRQQARRALPLVPTQELESPTLQLLLRAYAGHIRTVLRTPRQIKRFAGKARLQHHLLGALAQQQGPGGSFTFGPAEQVLAFVLLLVDEGGPALAPADAPLPTEQQWVQHLRTAYQAALLTGQLNTALAGQFRFRGGWVWLRAAPTHAAPRGLHRLGVALAPADSLTPSQQTLLRQLHWLNAGLLV